MIMWNWFFFKFWLTQILYNNCYFLEKAEGLIGNKGKINYLTRRKESTKEIRS